MTGLRDVRQISNALFLCSTSIIRCLTFRKENVQIIHSLIVTSYTEMIPHNYGRKDPRFGQRKIGLDKERQLYENHKQTRYLCGDCQSDLSPV